MLAIDTNVLVRLIAKDDLDQAARVQRLFETQAVFISNTVLLESEWVLKRGLGLSRSEARQAVEAIVGLPGVKVEDVAIVRRALDWALSGMDFADALHLAQAEACETFVTFDKRLKKSADLLGLPVREP